MTKDLIDKIKEEIMNWRKVSRLKETPSLPREDFSSGWRLGINRVCNTIERIINEN